MKRPRMSMIVAKKGPAANAGSKCNFLRIIGMPLPRTTETSTMSEEKYSPQCFLRVAHT